MTMTNKELAEKLENWWETEPGVFAEAVAEAARRLRSLPDPEPEPAKDLRWLVGRHECLSSLIQHEPAGHADRWPWFFEDDDCGGMYMSDTVCLRLIRGIVKSMCDEHGGSWFPTGLDVYPQLDNRWYYHWRGKNHYLTTELDAIDALLTAMKGTA